MPHRFDIAKREPGHTHLNDGKLYPTCKACIEERWLMLRLKGMSKTDADRKVREELAKAFTDGQNVPEVQRER